MDDEYISRQNEIMRAYRATFLDDGKPKPLAKLVLEDLAVFCGETRESRTLDHNGRVDEMATLYNAGRTDVMKRIRMWLARREAGYERYSDIDLDTRQWSRWREFKYWCRQCPLVRRTHQQRI